MMLRTAEARSERQRALKQFNQEEPDPKLLTLDQCAHLMKISRSTAYRLFRQEPDVHKLRTPGSRKPIIRVPRAVYERVLRRSRIPWQDGGAAQ